MKKSKIKKIIFFVIVIVLVLSYFYRNSPLFYRYTIFNSKEAIANREDVASYRERNGKVEKDKCYMDFEFTGLDTLWKLEVKEDSLMTFFVNMDVEGDFMLVVVYPDGRIFPLNSNGEENIEMNKGVYKIRMVGINAQGIINIKLKGLESVKVETFN